MAAGKKVKEPGAYQPAGASSVGRQRATFTLQAWSVRHARSLERVYGLLANVFLRLDPFWRWIGYRRAERPVKFVERMTKGLLFDCQMCGQCILSSTGMSCPMNCPKHLRNGPCGGVRANGMCEVEPEMPCVWVVAWNGSRNMRGGDAIFDVQGPVDQNLKETSAWLRITAQSAAARESAKSGSETKPTPAR